MAPATARGRRRKALIVGVIVTLSAIILGGGLVVSNAWAIGVSISQQVEPPTTVAPVAHRRWYARAQFFAPDSAASPVPDYADNAVGD